VAVALVLAGVFAAGVIVGQGQGPGRVEAGGQPAATEPVEMPASFGVFWEALRLVRERFVDEAVLDDETLTWGAIRGMVQSLGDSGHTVFLTPDEVESEEGALDGRIVGIGVVVDQRGGGPTVVSVLDGSPADRAGVRIGDVLLAVDGARTDRILPDDVLRRLRGDVGTSVTLRLLRTDGSELDVSMVRERILVDTVSWAFVPGTRIADVRLLVFAGGAANELRDALREALAAGAIGVVLDLRGNPGGYVAEAQRVASSFLDEGVVFQQRNRDGDVRPHRVLPGAVDPEIPTAVLIDQGSASASEIVAAALRDNDRATLIGERTFGTGTVLETYQLSDGSALRLGVARWLTPDGEDAFATGIEPDVRVRLPPGGTILEPTDLDDLNRRSFARSPDRQLRRAVRILTPEETSPPEARTSRALSRVPAEP
jgi:carboxyl-terminal processing protease